MSMTVTRSKDTKTPRVLMHKIADIRGGVSINVTELNVDYLPEGTPIGAAIDGISHVVKYALVQANATDSATKIKVYKGHNFQVGDVVCAAENGAAYAITAINTSNSAYDELTVGTTLGVALSKDVTYIFQAAEAGASGAALKYAPLAITGTGVKVEPNTNLNVDAWIFAVTKGNNLPSLIAGKLKGVVNY